MLVYTEGDIFGADCALVNPVNCVGVMGAGLALQFKQRFPENFRAYQRACQLGRVKLGEVFVFGGDPIIFNLPTKGHWREKSTLPSVALGVKDLRAKSESLGLEKVALPKVGCGLGGLPWETVRRALEGILADSKVEFVVYL